jgi:hypothetical protein
MQHARGDEEKCKNLVGNPEDKRSFGNIPLDARSRKTLKLFLKHTGMNMAWILAQNRVLWQTFLMPK